MGEDVCIHCSAVGCLAGVAQHAADCPFETSVWPVTSSDVAGAGLACITCHQLLTVGEHYTLQDGFVVCLGCDALQAAS